MCVCVCVSKKWVVGQLLQENICDTKQGMLFDLRNTGLFHLEKKQQYKPNMILYWPEIQFVIMFDSFTQPKKKKNHQFRYVYL